MPHTKDIPAHWFATKADIGYSLVELSSEMYSAYSICVSMDFSVVQAPKQYVMRAHTPPDTRPHALAPLLAFSWLHSEQTELGFSTIWFAREQAGSAPQGYPQGPAGTKVGLLQGVLSSRGRGLLLYDNEDLDGDCYDCVVLLW